MTTKVIKRERFIGVDLIKTFAIIFVIGVHFFLNTKFYHVDLDSMNMFVQVFIQQIFLTCIPLFLLTTGFLNNQTEISYTYFKKIIPIICIYLFYCIISLCYKYSLGSVELNLGIWINQILKFKATRYSWYINFYLGFFLLVPFFNRMYLSLKDKFEKRALIIILSILTLAVSKFHIPDYWAKIYLLTYFFIGKYFREYRPSMNKVKCAIYIFLIIFICAIMEYVVADGGKYAKYISHYPSIMRAIEAVLIFIFLYDISIKDGFGKNIITSISLSTLDIYLASSITDKIVYTFVKSLKIEQEKVIYFIIPIMMSTFLMAFALGKLRVLLFKNIDSIKNKTKPQISSYKETAV